MLAQILIEVLGEPLSLLPLNHLQLCLLHLLFDKVLYQWKNRPLSDDRLEPIVELSDLSRRVLEELGLAEVATKETG